MDWMDLERLWHHSRIALIAVAAGASLALLTGCDRGGDAAGEQAAQVELSAEAKQQLAVTSRAAWQLAETPIEQSLASAKQLHRDVEVLLEIPSAETLAAAQAQWRQVAVDFQPLHFYGSVAQLQPDRLERLRQLMFGVAAQPIQPGYLDSVGPYAHSGMVHDIGLPMTAESLRHQHGATDEEEAALGIYALQFMLFGVEPHSPRQAGDYAVSELGSQDVAQGYSAAEELPNNRRRQLLQAQAQLLVEDLERLRAIWQPQAENSLHSAFIDINPVQRHTLLLRALQLELLDLSAAVEDLAARAASSDEAPDPAAPLAPALESPELALARNQFLLQLAQTLALDSLLAEQLAQVSQGLQQLTADEVDAVAATAGISDSLTGALEEVTGALRVYSPSSSPATPPSDAPSASSTSELSAPSETIGTTSGGVD